MSAKGTKEKSRYKLLEEIAEMCSGVLTLEGVEPLPALLAYHKIPLTDETNKQIHKYIKEINKRTGKLGFQANLALHMRSKRRKV